MPRKGKEVRNKQKEKKGKNENLKQTTLVDSTPKKNTASREATEIQRQAEEGVGKTEKRKRHSGSYRDKVCFYSVVL